MDRTQKNKKDFLKPFKNMILKDDSNKGLIKVHKKCMADLEAQGKIKIIVGKPNTWYEIFLTEDVHLCLVEILPDYYKLVSGGKVGGFLQCFPWKYTGKNVVTSQAISGRSVNIERVILNYTKYHYFKPADIEEDAHHMWYRFCAVQGTLKSLPKDKHRAGHQKIGNYDRAQIVEIKSDAEFEYFISVVCDKIAVLSNKEFSLEF